MATLYGNTKNFRTQKVLAAAKYGNVTLNVSDGTPPAENFPFSATPAYTTGKKCLFGSDAIAWEVCGANLRGQTPAHQSEVIQWLQVAESEFLPAALGWVLPSISVMQHDKKAVETCKGEFLRLMSILDKFLLTRTFLVAERLSVADLSLAFDLSPAYAHVLEPSVRKNYVNVNRWYNTVMHQIEVTQVAGTPQLCEKAAQFDGRKFKEYQSATAGTTEAATPEDSGLDMRAGSPEQALTNQNEADSAGGSKKKKGKKDKKKKGGGEQREKEEKKKEKEKEKEPELEEELDETEKALAEEPKKKDPFDQFPKGNWNFDEFKRVYSNEDTETVAIPYFWEHFEPENYSIWYCEYKYPTELTLVFMSCNLIGGMFQRLDKMRKNSFGSMALFGENNNSTISGVWFWRGPELAFTIDYESYEWTKLDPADPKTKKLVQEYFTWEGDFDGKKFNQGKIFK